MGSLPYISTHDQLWESNPRLLIMSPMPYPFGHMHLAIIFLIRVQGLQHCLFMYLSIFLFFSYF